MSQHTTLEKAQTALAPRLEAQGFRIVLMRFLGSAQFPTLQIMLEHTDGQTVNLEECANANREIAIWLEFDEVMQGAYKLEVSSPGIDRPLVTFEDYIRFQGEKILLETRYPLEGQRKFRGVLQIADTESESVTLKQDHNGQETTIRFRDISQAKLRRSEDIWSDKGQKQSSRPPATKKSANT